MILLFLILILLIFIIIQIKKYFIKEEKEIIDYIYNNLHNIDIINEKINELLKINNSLNREMLLIKLEKDLIKKKEEELYYSIIINVTKENIKEKLETYKQHLNIFKDLIKISLNKN
jgi:phosphotransferase system IIA component